MSKDLYQFRNKINRLSFLNHKVLGTIGIVGAPMMMVSPCAQSLPAIDKWKTGALAPVQLDVARMGAT